MRNLILVTTFLFSFLAFGTPKEQDRAVLEGNDRNLLSNPGFEASKSGWSITGSGTFTIESGAPALGNLSGKWNPSATGEFLRSELIPIPEGLKGRACSLVFDYSWASGVSAEIKANIDDGTDDLATVDLEPSTLYRSSPPLIITCPSSGSLRVELESTADAEEISLDAMQLGKLQTVQVSQTELIAHAYYPATTNCLWARDNATLGAFGTDADCPAISVISGTGSIDTTDNDLPDIVINDAKPGIYEIVAYIPTEYDSALSHTAHWALINSVTGSTDSPTCARAFDSSTGSSSGRHIVCTNSLTITTAQNITFSVNVAENAAGLIQLPNNVEAKGELSFIVRKYPISSAEAITLETVGEKWDVNIGGANVDLGLVSVSSYTEIIDAGLDMVINPGSKVAEIPCSTTNPSTGLTCAAGSESIGIVIDVTTAGTYEVCGQFSHFLSVDASDAMFTTFQWIETPNNAQTILQRGKARVTNGFRGGSTSGTTSDNIVPYNLCGQFIFASAGQKTLRMMFEQLATGTPTVSDLTIDRAATVGQRDLHITVIKLDQQFPSAIVPEIVESLTAKVNSNFSVPLNHQVARILNSGTPTISGDFNNGVSWISSLTDVGVGLIGVNFTAGVFDGLNSPVCTCISKSNNVECIATAELVGSVQFNTTVGTTNTAVDVGINIHCTGSQ